jgi:hypothetical protein
MYKIDYLIFVMLVMLAVIKVPETLHSNRRPAVVIWWLVDKYYSQSAD